MEESKLASYMNVNDKVEAARKGLRIARASVGMSNQTIAQLYQIIMAAIDSDENVFMLNLKNFHTMILEARRGAGDVVEGLNAALVAIDDLVGPSTNDQVH